jgi:hypothetical protein
MQCVGGGVLTARRQPSSHRSRIGEPEICKTSSQQILVSFVQTPSYQPPSMLPRSLGGVPGSWDEDGRTRARQSCSSRLTITAWNLQDDRCRFRDRSLRLRGSLHVLTIRRY